MTLFFCFLKYFVNFFCKAFNVYGDLLQENQKFMDTQFLDQNHHAAPSLLDDWGPSF